ncbi:MAG: diaminopimelate decarboxylase [Verrucomicrobiae bacterium]|nr:diaminopimelate decarboxylase [Verrucomicrobiae bacterium]
MHDFKYVNGELYCEAVPVASLVKRYGTPLYIYSQQTLEQHFQKLDAALAELDHLICYAVKANSNLAVIRVLANRGSGFDIVSQGELMRVQAAGGNPRKCVFAGVGKTEAEIRYALEQDIYCFNVESEAELQRIERVAARLKRKAPVAIRVNPNVEAHTHAKITTGTYENKFGIAFEQVPALYARASRLRHLHLRGLQMHIGSQLTQVAPFRKAVEKVAPLAATLKERHGIEFFSIGGGLGIVYDPALASGVETWWKKPQARSLLTPARYAEALVPLLKPLGLKVLIEPGRFIVGNAGILVTRVEYLKRTGKKNFVIVDAAMNDLIRPAFYDAYHEIVPLRKKAGALIPSDVVGPVCESGDYFCKDRPLPRVQEGDCLALLSAGAYGSVMGSNYNTRPRPAEILVHGRQHAVVRQAEDTAAIWKDEKLAPWLQD